MDKNILTTESGVFYTESLKTSLRGFRTRQICDFFVFAYGRMRAENISNIGQSIRKLAFSESARHSILVVILKKVYKMTNTIISKISEVRYILDAIYANTDSQHLAMRCSAVRKELADLIIEILDQEQIAAE